MSARSKALTVNVDARTLDRLDRHVARHRPFLSRHAAHWVALNIGLNMLERAPELLVEFLEQEPGDGS